MVNHIFNFLLYVKKNNIELYYHIFYLFKICRPQSKNGPMIHYLPCEVFDLMAWAWKKLKHIEMEFCVFCEHSPTISSSGVVHWLTTKYRIVKPRKIQFLRKGRTVKFDQNPEFFSRYWMMKRTSPLESSCEIYLPRRISSNSETVRISRFSRYRE